MTGLPRKEVQKIKQLPSDSDIDATTLLSPLADLLHLWATSDRFQSHDGQPRILSVGSKGENSFDELVKSTMGDLPPGAVRAELVRLGAVISESEGDVRLVRRSLIPPQADSRLESAILYSMCGLASTVAHNNDPRTPDHHRRFERFVESRPLTPNEIAGLRERIRTRLTEVTEELDLVLNEASGDESEPDQTLRIGVGLFYSE